MPTLNELRAELARRYADPSWQVKRKECFAYWLNRCAVCGYDWTKSPKTHLQAHHTPEGYKNLWKENARKRHLVPLCKPHHPKGRLTYSQIVWLRQRYLLWKALCWTVLLPFRLAYRLAHG